MNFRALDDNDDEVRDRAVFFLRIIGSEDLCMNYSSNGKSVPNELEYIYNIYVFKNKPMVSRGDH